MNPTAPILYPPGPKTPPFYALRTLVKRDPIGLFTRMAAYGDVTFMRIGQRCFYMLNDPELIHRVLVTDSKNFIKSEALRNTRDLLGQGLLTSEGDLHLRQRRLASPAFHQQRIAGYARTMVEYAGRTGQRWQPGATADMAGEMMRLTLSVAGKTLFDADVENEASEIGWALTEAMRMFTRSTNPLGPLLERLPLPSNARARRAYQRLDSTIYRLIDEHRAHPGHDDLLEMLMSAQDEDDGGAVMTDRQLRDEAMTIFLAGHETTALATTWSWYLLALNPGPEKTLHEELDRVLKGRLPGYEDIPRLPYTRMVLAEALRMYPPAFVIGREPLVDYRVREYTIPAGASIFLSQYITQHDPRFFPEPDCFDPLRFTPEAEAKRPRFAYFPFGGGPRVCIGEPFAWTEGILILAALAQRWQPRLASSQPVKLEPMITLRPKGGVWMKLEERS